MAEKEVFVNELKYYEELGKFYAVHDRSNKKPWSSEKLNEIYQILSNKEALEHGKKKTNEFYYYSRMYETLQEGDSRAVIKKRSKAGSRVIHIVPYEGFYKKLYDTHTSTGHGGRDKMLLSLKSQCSIPRPAVEVFVKCCTKCAEKKQPVKKNTVKPGFPKGWYYRGQVDLVDLRSSPDGEYHWLMVYEDYRTRFVLLRPLKSNRIDDVSIELLKVFLEFGVPKTLHSGNGSEFVDNIVQNMSLRWPLCKMINDQPDQSQADVNRSIQDVEDMLQLWLKEHKTTNWSLGCYFVERRRNSAYDRTIRCTPFRALFGVDFLGGHSTSEGVKVKTEEDWETMFNETSDNYRNCVGKMEDFDGFRDASQINREIKIEPVE